MFAKIKEFRINIENILEVKEIEKKEDGLYWVTIEFVGGAIKGYSFETRKEAELIVNKITIPNGLVS
jgi:hypothetical protein